MTRHVYACADCGREAHSRYVLRCPDCHGQIEQVDPLLVATMDALEALVAATIPTDG